MALEDILKLRETMQRGEMQDKLAMMSPQQAPMAPQQASMAPQQAPIAPPMPPQQAPMAPPMPPQQPPMPPQEKEKKTLVGKLLNTDVKVADGSISKIGIELVEARIDKMPPVENALQAMLPQSNTVNQMVDQSRNTVTAAQGGGLMQLAAGGEFSGPVPGNGGGMEDNVMMPIKEGQEQVATLAVSPTEYVVDSYTMAALGNGNPDEGAQVMDSVIENVREKAYGTSKQPNEISGLAALSPMMERV